MLSYILYLGVPYIYKKLNLKTAGNLAFSQTGSQFVYACAVDLRVRPVIFAGLFFSFASRSSQTVIRMYGKVRGFSG